MPRLGVNIDHVATLREARKTNEPDPVMAAGLVELAGAEQITIHLREDRRHIQDRDLRLLKGTTRLLLNLEMAAAEQVVEIAVQVKPDSVTLVPERREELTTEGGLDVVGSEKNIAQTIVRLHSDGIPVSLFIGPDIKQAKAATKIGADAIEIHTGEYANAVTPEQASRELERIRSIAAAGAKLGLHVHAGHGLTYQNVRPIVDIREIEELNIGHSIIARAVMVGLEQAVRDMLALVRTT